MGWGKNLYELVRIPIKKVCKGYYLRWYYNGWHYWFFLPGRFVVVTEGEKYRTIGTRKVSMGSGQITRGQAQAIRTIMNTREVYLLTIAGWMSICIERNSINIYDNQLTGTEIEFVAIIGSKEISYTDGYSPVEYIPEAIPPAFSDYCEIAVGNQIWMCYNWWVSYPNSKVYNDDEDNRDLFGGLYTYAQIMSPGFCPAGWHVPTLAEWQELIDYVGGDAVAGGELKSIGFTYWYAPNTGAIDAMGLSFRGAGYYNIVGTGNYRTLYEYSRLWTADEGAEGLAQYVRLHYNSASIVKTQMDKRHFASVRLIKDSYALLDYDNNGYTSIIIGNQEWLTSNLKVTHYADGTPITNIITSEYTDWFLPSQGELAEMYSILHLSGLGGFANVKYWSSHEFNATTAWAINFNDGSAGNELKSSNQYVRACRSFVAGAGDYALRDTGPAGGLIFHIAGGTTYYESALIDQSIGRTWSNIINVLIGTTSTLIGEGVNNTAEIIAQAGHTDSAASICDSLSMGGWINDVTGAYCWYNNDIGNKNSYGALYNWYTVNNAHNLVYLKRNGIQEPGWRIAISTDWNNLLNYLGGNAIAGGKLKEMGLEHWHTPNTGATDQYGFTARGEGCRIYNTGVYAYLKKYNFIWASNEFDANNAYYVYMAYNSIVSAIYSNGLKNYGFSVRLVRDI